MVSLLSKRLSRVFPSTTVRRHQFFSTQPFLLSSCYICTSVQSLSQVQLFATPWLEHARPPSPSPTPGAYSNSCPLSPWCHPTISSLLISFSSCLQSCPASRYFLMSQFFVSGGQSIRVLASASVLPMNIQDWFPLGWTGWISLQSKGLKSLLPHHNSRAWILWHSAFFVVQPSHPYMTIGKTIALTRRTFVSKVMSLLVNMLSRLVITFLPRSKCLFNFMAAVSICSDFGAQEKKSLTVSIVSPSICHEVIGPDAMIFVFWMLSFKQAFSSPLLL